MFQSSLQNRRYFSPFSGASEGKRDESEEHETPAERVFPRRTCPALHAHFVLCSPEKRRKIAPFVKAISNLVLNLTYNNFAYECISFVYKNWQSPVTLHNGDEDCMEYYQLTL